MPFFGYQGHQLHYRLRGRGDLLILLPGNTASSASHEGELAHFSKRYCVAALDFLGVGRSDRVPSWPDDWWREGAHQAEALRRHLGGHRAIVMGTSGGAIVALWMADLFGDAVVALIADSFSRCFTSAQYERNVVADRGARTDGQLGFWHLAHGGDWEEVIAADTALLARLAQGGGQWLPENLSGIGCPVLLTGSAADRAIPFLPHDLAELVDEMPDCRLYLHPDGDHPFMWSRGDAFRAQADLFLRGLP